MKNDWEFLLLELIGLAALTGLIAYGLAFQFFHRQRRCPVYGPAAYRVMGSQARRNLRLVGGQR